MKIEIVNVSNVREGEWITEVDDDRLRTNEAVNTNYDAADQFWVRVTAARHQADISHVTVLTPAGDAIRSSGDGDVWRLVDDAGVPVTALSPVVTA